MSPTAVHACAKFLAFLADAAFRSLLLACFLAAALAAFRVRVVRTKLSVWRGVLFVAMAMPVLMLLSPAVSFPVPVPSFSRNATTAPLPVAQTALQAAHDSSTPIRSRDGERSVLGPESTAPVSQIYLPLAPLPGFPLPRASRLVSWPFAVLSLYLGVALYFFVRLLIGMYFARRLRRRSQMIGDANALNLLAAASRRLRRAPHFAESELLAVPVTLGIADPAVLLPSSWRDWEPHELAAVLVHEISHVMRRDSLVQVFALVHRAIFWFSPLSWWLERHLCDLAEQASDEAALTGGADRTRYAQALLGFLADLEASPARVWWHGVAMAKSGEGEKRVDRILAWRSPVANRCNRLLVAALIVTSVPAVALSVVARPAAYRPQDVSAPPAPAPPLPPQELVPPPDAMAVPLAAPVVAPVVPSVAPPAPVEIAQPVPMVPPQVAVAASVPPQPPQSPSQDAAPPAPPVPPPPMAVPPPARGWSGYGPDFGSIGNFYWPWGPQFVIVTRDSDHLIMSGSEDDAEHARALREKISGDFIWFEHDGKAYIIRDQAVIDRAKRIWAQRGDSAKLQQELQAKQQELSKQMREQVQQRMEEIRVKVPDMSTELQKLQSEIKDLNAKGATLQQLNDLQREVGEMQRSLGEARWNSNMQEINRRAGEIGRQMGDLGRQIGEIARREVEQGRQAAEQMRQLLDDAITRGLAKPE